MDNLITICAEKKSPLPMFSSLDVGEMFRFVIPADSQNVYMKTSHIMFSAINLRTGYSYEFSPDKPIEKIPAIKIER